jgi:hypothetical protein
MSSTQATTPSTHDIADAEAVHGSIAPPSAQVVEDAVEASSFHDVYDARHICPPAPTGGSVIPLPIIQPFVYAPSLILANGIISPECVSWLTGPEESTMFEEIASMDHAGDTWHIRPGHSHSDGTRTPSPIDNALALMLTPFPETAFMTAEDDIDAFLWQAAIFDTAPEGAIEEEQMAA